MNAICNQKGFEEALILGGLLSPIIPFVFTILSRGGCLRNVADIHVTISIRVIRGLHRILGIQ